MSGIDFPLLYNENTPIKRKYEVLFHNFRYSDVFLQYLIPTSSKYSSQIATAIYYDICTLAIKEYIERKTTRLNIPATSVPDIISDLYDNYNAERFDVILHKALHNLIQNIYYVQPRNKRVNKYEAIHEIVSSHTIYSNMFDYYNPSNTDFESEGITDYLVDNYDISIADYVSDYVLLSRRVGECKYNMIDSIQHMFNRIRCYIREYYGIMKMSFLTYKVIIANNKATIDYIPNSQRIQYVERKIQQGVFKPTPECVALGIVSVSLGKGASKNNTDVPKFLRKYKLTNRINPEPLKTITGRAIRYRHLQATGEGPRAESWRSTQMTKFGRTYPHPIDNLQMYREAMKFGIEYTKTEYDTLRDLVHRILKLRSLLYLTLHIHVDMNICAQHYNRYVEPIAKVLKFRASDIISLRSDDDYKLLDTMIALYKILTHLRLFNAHVNTNTTEYIDVSYALLITDAVLITKSMCTYFTDHIWYEANQLHGTDMSTEYKLFWSKNADTIDVTLKSILTDLISSCKNIYNFGINLPYVRDRVKELFDKYDRNRILSDREALHFVYVRVDPSKMGNLSAEDDTYYPGYDDREYEFADFIEDMIDYLYDDDGDDDEYN